ncbi:MAG TPA: phosphatase PAP2 family protein [Flavisolibacter sp.]|nr:phosphatase PAP2 family protein [Flavisolibacter sp.]
MFRRISARVKKILAGAALLSVEMAIVVSLFICALVVFIFVARRIFVLHSTTFDQRVFTYLKEHVSERNNDLVLFFTFLGSHEFLIPANLVLIGYFLLIRKHKWHSIKVPAIAISSLLLMFVLKRLFNRPRPDIPLLYEAKGLSFPSGHALMSVTFYGLLIYIVFKTYRDKDWKWIIISLLILLILIIGFTRVYLRVHYTTDVIAGYCIGFLWLVFAVWFLNRLEKYSKKKLDAVVKQEPAPVNVSASE